MLAAPALHWAALALAACGVGCGLRRRRGDRAGVAVAAVTGAVMLAAMADTAAGTMLLGPWTPLAWTGTLLAAGVIAAWVGRRATHAPVGTHDAVDAGAGSGVEAPLHLLHVTCLPVMAALTAAMAQHATAPAGPHAHGGALTAVALAAAAVHVAAGCGVTLGRRRRRVERVEALAGAGAVAAMAGALL